MPHEYVSNLEPDHPLSEENVKLWIKHNKHHLKSIRHYANSNSSKERQEFHIVETYIENLQTYLRTGTYLDHRWGLNGDKRINYICYAKAYDENGVVKRNVNTWYDDIGWYKPEG